MGKCLQVITGQATNPGAGPVAVTMNAGDSNTIQNASLQSRIRLIQAWAFTNTNLLARIRSPKLHDQAQAFRLQPTAAQPYPLLPWGAANPMYPQDPLTIELSGGAAEVDLISALLYYDDLPGIGARLHAPGEIYPLIDQLTTVEVDIASAAASAAYGPTTALNGTFDTLVRNCDYAILGYTCGTTGGTLGIRGPDTGNTRLGGPLTNLAFVTDNWFVRLSQEYGIPLVPVFNSANVTAMLLDCACQAVSASFHIGLHLAQLTQPLQG